MFRDDTGIQMYIAELILMIAGFASPIASVILLDAQLCVLIALSRREIFH